MIITGVAASYEDIKNMEISKKMIIIGTFIGVAYAIFKKDLPGAVRGSVIMAAPLYIMAYAYMIITGKQGFGGGDVKIAFIYGLYLKNIESIAAAYFTAFILAGFFILIRKVINHRAENTVIPLIPFMSISSIVMYSLENFI